MLLFLQTCWHITLELAPWLLLGALAGGVLHVALPAGWLSRQLTGKWGVVKSVALGVPLPLCSCGVIPVGLSLRKEGASRGAVVGFLISTPQTGVDSILVSGALLGWPFALFKVAAATVTGIVGGWLADASEKRLPSLPVLQQSTPIQPDRSLRTLLGHASELLHSVWRWLAVGVMGSALITLLVPADAFAGLGPTGPLMAMLLTLLISAPLYVCATASVPIAASLVASGLPSGAALVFLMAGPATNLATIGAVKQALGTKALAIYLAVIILGSIAAGLLFEAVLPGNTAMATLHNHQHQTWWAIACAVLLLALCVRFAWQDFRRLLPSALPSHQPSLSIGVEGMTCHVCTNKLEQALRKSSLVDSARVELTPGRATITGSATPAELAALVHQAGFTPVPDR